MKLWGYGGPPRRWDFQIGGKSVASPGKDAYRIVKRSDHREEEPHGVSEDGGIQTVLGNPVRVLQGPSA